MRAIKIKSKEHLYKILKKHDTLHLSNNKFCAFFDFMYEYLYGCDCMKDEHLKLVTEEYQSIANDEELRSEIMKYFSVDAVFFIVPI